MNFQTSYQVGATFKIEKFKEDGTITYQGEEFHNEVLNCGLLLLFGTSLIAATAYVNLGSSNTPVDITQTGLLDRKFSTNTLFNGSEWASTLTDVINNCSYSRIFQFNIGTCTGTFKEIGLSKDNNANYFNRQLIKDSNGNPMDLVVAADEGIRIVMTASIYLDPSIRYFSEILELDIKGATAGSITFNNGSSDITVQYHEMTSTGGYYNPGYWYLSKIPKTPTSGCLTDKSVVNSKIRFYGMLENTTAFNITIKSHTLTGGTGEPTITTILPFQSLGAYNKSFTLTNDTTLETKTINYRTFMYFNYNARNNAFNNGGDMSKPWGRGTGGVSSQLLIERGLGWFDACPITGNPFSFNITEISYHTSATVLHEPNINELWRTLKVYYAPGFFGTGDKSLTGAVVYHDPYYYGPTHVFQFDQPIVLPDTYEFEFTVTVNFGRYTPA